MNEIVRIFIREVKGILSRKSYLFLFIAWPLLDGIVLGGIYAQKVVVKIPVAVADCDRSSLSRTLVRSLDACRSLEVRYRVNSGDELRELLLSQKAVAGVFIPEGTEREVKRGGQAVVTAFLNGSNLLTANLSLSDLRTVVGTVAAGVKIKYLEKGGASSERALALQSPVKVDLTKLYNPGYNYMNYLAPGIWLALLFQVIMLFGALMIATELDKGTFGELRDISGGNAVAVAAGKFPPYILISLFLLETVFRVFFPLFGIPMKGNVTLLMTYSLLFVLAGLSMGFFLSVLLGNRSDAIKGALLLAAPAFLLSGYTWPLASMPAAIRALAWCIPLTGYLQGVRKVFQQGAGATYLGGEAQALVLIVVVCLGLGLGILALRLRKEPNHVR